MLIQDVLPPKKIKKIIKQEVRIAKIYVKKKVKKLNPFLRFGIFACLLIFVSSNAPYAFASTCSTPTVNNAAGTYTSTVTVTLSTSTGSAKICYTTDGTTPAATTPGTCSTGSTYSSALTFTSTTTLKALATRSGYTNSGVFTGVYTIQAAGPTFSPGAGAYSSTQIVTISSTTPSAVICYTIDGSTPAAATPGTCSAGTTYSGTVSVSSAKTIKALATKSGMINSAVTSAAYTFTSTDAALSNLTISAGTLSPTFASGTTSYTDGAGNVPSITVTPTVNQANATVKVNTVTVASGSPSGDIVLNVGDNTVSVVVTAQDGTTTTTYTITVNRTGSNRGVSISGGGMMMF